MSEQQAEGDEEERWGGWDDGDEYDLDFDVEEEEEDDDVEVSMFLGHTSW